MLASAAPLDLSAWKYRKRIPLTPGDGLAVVKLDREVYLGALGSLADMRVIHDNQEVPYVVHEDRDEPGDVTRRSQIVDRGVVEGKGVRFTLITHSPHNRVHIETKRTNFRQRVIIEASQDNENWATIRSDGEIFDFSKDGRELSSWEVPYPVSTRRYLRVTVLGWMEADSVATAVPYRTEARAQNKWEVLSEITPVITEDSSTQSTLLLLDQGVSGLPIVALQLTTPAPVFHRGVSVDASQDGKNWPTCRPALYGGFEIRTTWKKI
jgi:hypothetical protein